jgi:hypothetical protein
MAVAIYKSSKKDGLVIVSENVEILPLKRKIYILQYCKIYIIVMADSKTNNNVIYKGLWSFALFRLLSSA